ncbi:very-long-chain 3-oxoacyl-CoA reductase 1 isoform X2 [Phoenix dactylifera]|uniref:Very-long-chain 3-oxoacyl-CoA reductase 1 isoform X2 n=1 Tax=Phoenix dactylifera TaxID=42345 RepID=A0A8B8J8F1_PHODC|nr:very-long-chain 3-oxoacyl-CoA reductase 1 isoform X2 [Phoenix dactylifera]
MESPFIGHLQEQPTWVLLLSFLGFLSLLQTSITLLKWAYAAFLRPGKDLKAYGSWALVTGATDGIGKAFAFQLAHEGLNLVLIGRNPSKLRRVSGEIKARHPCTEIKLVVMDLAGDLSDGIRRLEEEIRELEVGILVNNAGMTYPQFMYFHEVEEELWEGIVKVNMEATTRVTQAVLPGMMKRRRGAVVCIGSASSVVVPSFPLAAVYAATKALLRPRLRKTYGGNMREKYGALLPDIVRFRGFTQARLCKARAWRIRRHPSHMLRL